MIKFSSDDWLSFEIEFEHAESPWNIPFFTRIYHWTKYYTHTHTHKHMIVHARKETTDDHCTYLGLDHYTYRWKMSARSSVVIN